MKLSRTALTVIAVLILVVWIVLAWFLGEWLHLHSPAIWVLRVGLWVIGLAGFIGYLLLCPKDNDAARDAAAGNPEIDFAFNEAAKRMRAALGIKQLGSMPVIFVMGEAGSAKTSVIAKSGLEPELLAGHAYDDYVVAPTRALNLWLAHNTLFIDPAGQIVGDAPSRRKLFRKFLPVRLTSVVAAQLPPSRAVVFTVDCDIFLQPGAAEALAGKARQFQGVLTELAQILGSSFPVYVLFTKADKIAYFRDYVENLTEAEASEVFGVTLPIQNQQAQGVYAEQQNRRITEAFQELYRSLCDKRPPYLAREHDPSKLPNVYEFPREFGKLRTLLAQFLVDLCRPSQLGTSPFLRGFYFTGIRPVTVADLAPAAAQIAVREEQPIDAGATRIFNPRMQGAPLAEVAPGPQAGSRKVPQWVFLGHLFSDVILVDRPATAVTQSNVKVNFARRFVMGTVAVLALFMALWWVISFTDNSALVHGAIDESRAAQADNLAAGQLASADALQHLSNIRGTLARLSVYENSTPFSYGAFLYTGDSIREPLRAIYYQTFRKLLLAPTQNNLVQICNKPDAAPSSDYVYDSLEAYLITTQYANKVPAMPTFTTVLLDRWKHDLAATKLQQDLALENFQFYAADLAQGNPYSDMRPNEDALGTAREYLANYNQEAHIYHMMLADAGRGQKPIIFNQDYPDSRGIIINMYPVDPAFSKTGSDNFAKELSDPKRYFHGEEWVLGKSAAGTKSTEQLKQEFAAMYSKDLIQRWQNYLNATSVAPYANLQDAVSKLDRLGNGGQSPLMRVLCVASENISKNNDAKAAFQPVEVVTPPGCMDQPASPNASTYLGSLLNLKGQLQPIAAAQQPDTNAINAANSVANQTETDVSKLSSAFAPGSPVFNKTTQLLKDPITHVPPLLDSILQNAQLGPVNGGAGGVCAAMAPMLTEYPFNSSAKNEASVEELNQLLNPQSGKLWQFVNSTLKQFVTLSGTDYVANPAEQQKPFVTKAYLRFLNRAKHLTDALYKNGASPSLTFSIQPAAAADLDHVTLTIDGTTLSTDPKQGTSKTFAWPGTTQNAVLSVRYCGAPNDLGVADKSGLWAVWRLLDTAQKVALAGSQYQVQWAPETSAGPTTCRGHAITIPFVLDAQGSQIFSRGYFSGLNCVSKAVE